MPTTSRILKSLLLRGPDIILKDKAVQLNYNHIFVDYNLSSAVLVFEENTTLAHIDTTTSIDLSGCLEDEC